MTGHQTLSCIKPVIQVQSPQVDIQQLQFVMVIHKNGDWNFTHRPPATWFQINHSSMTAPLNFKFKTRLQCNYRFFLTIAQVSLQLILFKSSCSVLHHSIALTSVPGHTDLICNARKSRRTTLIYMLLLHMYVGISDHSGVIKIHSFISTYGLVPHTSATLLRQSWYHMHAWGSEVTTAANNAMNKVWMHSRWLPLKL